MDPRRFDELTTLLGAALSRRAGLRAALGAALAGAPGFAAAGNRGSRGGRAAAEVACLEPGCLAQSTCCGKTGQCVTTSAAACGKPGKRCLPCKSGQRCIDGECRCPGCVDQDGKCRKGGSGDACGKNGAVCQKCGKSLRCVDVGNKEVCLPCSARSCPDGCCSKSGECIETGAAGACGLGGVACKDCGRGKFCVDGRCVDCAGCYDGGTCVTGRTTKRCGRGGALCKTCPAGQSCEEGVCVYCAGCYLSGACVAGTTRSACGRGGGSCRICQPNEACADGACVACNGCIDSAGVCRRGIDRDQCGAGGEPCAACPAGKVCAGGRCVICPGCLQSGVCEAGTANNRCGANGSSCASCENGQRCVNRACVCDAVSCPNGCCDGNRCRGGASDTACGSGGVACTSCAASYTCQNKTCQLNPGACVGCTSGCCDNGTCRNGDSNANCGKNGEPCAACTGAKTCESGSCTTCAGCIDNGTCKAGTSTSACGKNAGACSTCAASESCVSGACECTGCKDAGVCKAGTTIVSCGKDGAACTSCSATQSCNSGACGACNYSQVPGVLGEFGANGSGTGQFDKPVGIAATSDGRLLVSDARNDRVTVWTYSSGSWSQTGSFGSSGTGTGEFDFPWGMEIAPNGAAFICDLWNNRVVIWEESGGSWSQTGEFGTYGSGTGNLDYPNDVAVISNDKVLVADDNSRISVWEKSGGSWSNTGSFGDSGVDLLSYPNAVTYDSVNSKVFVGDLNYPLSEWNFSGSSATYAGTIGVVGNGCSTGEIGGVGSLLASAPGGVPTLWVADWTLNRLSRWEKTAGTWGEAAATPFDAVKNPGGLTAIAGVHYSTSYDDDLVAAVDTICGCTGCRGTTQCETGTSDQMCGSNGEVCVACANGEYCADGACANCTEWNQVGQIPFGTGSEALAVCSGIAPWTGKVLVADGGNSDINSRVGIWQQNGGTWSYVTNFGDGTISTAYGIAVTSDNRVLVTESSEVSEWAESAGNWSKLGTFASTSDSIENVAVGAGDLVYAPLTDASSGDLIQVWQKTAGSWSNIESFAGYGSGPTELDTPKGIAVTADGRVWICDSGNNRVSVWQKTASTWGCVARFGEATLVSPYAIAADGTNILVADNNGITAWSESGGSFTLDQTIVKAIAGCGGWTFKSSASEALALIGGVLYVGQKDTVTTWTDSHCP